MSELLFEIGTEELPASFVRPAVESVERTILAGLARAGLAHGPSARYATPRRLAVLVEGVAERSPDTTERLTGPPVRIAFDADGNPTKAASAFARRAGVPVDRLDRTTTEKGEYLTAEVLHSGQAAPALLPAILAEAMAVDFPKSMRWGDVERSFARPVQWICALLGADVVPVRFGDVESDRTTRGHRFMAPGPIELAGAAEYEKRLADAHVIACPDRRRAELERQLDTLAAGCGGKVRADAALVEEVTFLVEEPFALAGRFDAEFKELPDEVLIQEMRDHQRYFIVLDETGSVLPRFIAVSNTRVRNEDVSRAGYERVLRARLADGRFFFTEDCKQSLESRVEELDRVVFQRELGSIGQKVARVTALTRWLAEASGHAELAEAATRAAHLSKADLVSLMVGEFPDLQGVMGREYALRDGEDEAVARAIRDHYLPRGGSDTLPDGLEGALVGIADRADSLVGLFAVGRHPRSTADPFGLRRACIGILRLAQHFDLRFSLRALVAQCDEQLEPILAERSGATRGTDLGETVLAFFRGRMKALWSDAHRLDVVEAVLAADHDDIAVTARRIEALAQLVEERDFSPVATVFKRVTNLVTKVEGGQAPEALSARDLPEGAERELHAAVTDAAAQIASCLRSGDYVGAFRAISALEQPLSRFFDDVMVMTEDPAERQRRLGLLHAVAALFAPLADLGQLSGPP